MDDRWDVSKAILVSSLLLVIVSVMARISSSGRFGSGEAVLLDASIPSPTRVCARAMRACMLALCYPVFLGSSLKRITPRC